MKRLDAIKEDETRAILNVLGFGIDGTDLSAAETGRPMSQHLPEEREAFEKHKHALTIIVHREEELNDRFFP